jgi:hypothetical protein
MEEVELATWFHQGMIDVFPMADVTEATDDTVMR